MNYTLIKLHSRRFLLSIFVSSLLISCKSQTTGDYDLNKLIATISGKVINHSSIASVGQNATPQFVKVAYYDIASGFPVTIVSEIEPNGNYQIKFSIMNFKNVFFIYGNSGFSLFVTPGDTLKFNFAANKIAEDAFKVNFDIIRFEERNKGLNEQYIKYQEQTKSKFRDAFREMAQSSTIEEFLELSSNYRTMKAVESSKVLNEMNAHELLKKLIKYEVEYEYYYILFMYKPDNVKVPKTYYNFINESLMNNEKAIISNWYLAFLHHVRMHYLHEMPGLNPSFNEMTNFLITHAGISDEEKDLLQATLNDLENDTSAFYGSYREKSPAIAEILDKYKNKINSAHIHNRINYYLSKSSGFPKDMFLTNEVFLMLKFFGLHPVRQNWNLYLSNIENSYLCARALERFNEVNVGDSRSNMAEGAVIHDSIFVDTDFFNEIISKYKGNVVYIDFWAVWCGPCIGQFQYSKELYARYNKKDVVFLYFCVQSDKKIWQSDINKHGLKGDHYLLNDNQYDLLSKKFGISGIPHYALIDKLGNIYRKKAARPRQAADLIKNINHLLSTN